MFFKRRQKATIEIYCRAYYLMNMLQVADPNVPPSAVQWQNKGIEAASKHFDAVIQSIMKSSPVFVSREEQLRDEMTIIRFMLFSLAFYHRTNFNLSVAQFGYTSSLLIKLGMEPCWDAMGHYVTGVAKMVDRVFIKDDEKRRVQIDVYRFDSFKNSAANSDSKYFKESVARTLNFYGCPRDWHKTPRAIAYVAARVPERMGISVDALGDTGGVAVCLAVQDMYESLVKEFDEYDFSLK